MLVFECNTTPEEIREIQDKMLAVAIDYGAQSLQQSRLLLVLDELLTNIRLHAYPGKPGLIKIEVEPETIETGAILHVTIYDWGGAFNPLLGVKIPPQGESIEERELGGLGLYLVHNIVCGLAYTREKAEHPLQEYNKLALCIALQ